MFVLISPRMLHVLVLADAQIRIGRFNYRFLMVLYMRMDAELQMVHEYVVSAEWCRA